MYVGTLGEVGVSGKTLQFIKLVWYQGKEGEEITVGRVLDCSMSQRKLIWMDVESSSKISPQESFARKKMSNFLAVLSHWVVLPNMTLANASVALQGEAAGGNPPASSLDQEGLGEARPWLLLADQIEDSNMPMDCLNHICFLGENEYVLLRADSSLSSGECEQDFSLSQCLLQLMCQGFLKNWNLVICTTRLLQKCLTCVWIIQHCRRWGSDLWTYSRPLNQHMLGERLQLSANG